MDILFVAGFSVITTDPGAEKDLFVEALGLPLQPPPGMPDSEYVYSESIPGAKHLGVWPLSDAAQSCFGKDAWPDSHPVPQATIEFEVADVEGAAQELVGRGYTLVHPTRTEPWQQTIARFQASDGLLIAVCSTPGLSED
ncbi:glyoxalase [Aeromicrobium sp. A1-2]|nr:glyoxalase [Aeromicrobium sp. A1-2]